MLTSLIYEFKMSNLQCEANTFKFKWNNLVEPKLQLVKLKLELYLFMWLNL